jgi:hypothetical protein
MLNCQSNELNFLYIPVQVPDEQQNTQDPVGGGARQRCLLLQGHQWLRHGRGQNRPHGDR